MWDNLTKTQKGAVGENWVARLQNPLGERLQQLLDTPDG